MWKYVPRRIRDTFERSVNHFEKRSTTGVVNSVTNASDDQNKRSAAPCCWFSSRKCWNSFNGDNDTNSKRWNFDEHYLDWIGAITWSSALVVGWYTSQLYHLKYKYNKNKHYKNSLLPVVPVSKYKKCLTVQNLISTLDPNVKHFDKDAACLNSATELGKIIETFTPTLYSISNDQIDSSKEGATSISTDRNTNPDTNEGEVQNSIENRPGLAANKNSQHQNLISTLDPYVDKEPSCLNSATEDGKAIETFTPTLYLISNDQTGSSKERATSTSTDTNTNPDTSDGDLAEVLNSIENRLGLAAIENGQHQDGLNLLRSAASRNHAPALYNLGLCYEIGIGVKINEKAAMELFRSAAVLEHPGALYNLGIYYGQGRGGLTRDIKTASRLLKLAAVQGQEDAVNALKSLDVDSTASSTRNDTTWNYQYSPYTHNDIVPTFTNLFAENVNYIQD